MTIQEAMGQRAKEMKKIKLRTVQVSPCSPGADVSGVSPCSPGADVAAMVRVLAQMWQRLAGAEAGAR
jgi:hypothetical protein